MSLNVPSLRSASVGCSPSDLGPSFMDPPGDGSNPRRLDFVEGTDFTPPSKSRFSAGKPASRQLMTHLLESKKCDSQPRGRTRSETRELI